MAKKKRRLPQRILERPGELVAQRSDVWQADFGPVPHWVKIAGRPVRPWIVLVISRSDDLILAHEITEEPPSANLLWNVLVRAMTNPAAGEPHRPTELQVRPDERWVALKAQLDEMRISVVRTEELHPLNGVFKDMARHIAGDDLPGLLAMPGFAPEKVASFYRAASKFYRRAPWSKVGDEMAIKVECGRFESGPWYAVVMGQAGVTFGLTLYDDLRTLKKLWVGNMSDEQSARETVALTVMFDDETGVPVADLDASKRFGWEVAGPAAHPWVFRKERGLSVRPPLAWELELLEGSLGAVVAFVARIHADDLSRHEMTVPVVTGNLDLTLSWVAD